MLAASLNLIGHNLTPTAQRSKVRGQHGQAVGPSVIDAALDVCDEYYVLECFWDANWNIGDFLVFDLSEM